jgi:hypothetical protein
MPYLNRPPDRIVEVSAEAMAALEDVSHKAIQYDITEEEAAATIEHILAPFLDRPIDPDQYTQITVKPKLISIPKGLRH